MTFIWNYLINVFIRKNKEKGTKNRNNFNMYGKVIRMKVSLLCSIYG